MASWSGTVARNEPPVLGCDRADRAVVVEAVRELTYVYWRKDPSARKKPKVRRTAAARDYKYRAWVRSLPSAVSGYHGCEAAHTGSDVGTSTKASDYSCIPLTPAEHREYHSIGKLSFERKYGLSCAEVVDKLNQVWFRFSREVK
jgi:hypothetical protein